MTAREEAIRRLRRIDEDGAFAGLTRDDGELDARDVRFATELVSGVTRWRRWLDFLIAHFYRGEAAGLELDVRLILRVGIYELLVLEAPPHAAVNEAAELAKQIVRKGAAGLVNGILRSIDRARHQLPEPKTGDEARDLAIRQSHPTWMVRRWLRRYGAEGTAQLLAWNNSRPVYGLRANTARTTADDLAQRLASIDVEAEVSPYDDNFFRVQALQPIFRAGLIRDGLCVIQDEGAGLIVRLLDPQPHETVVDACAAPGGKSLYAAALMDGQGEVVAVDVNEARAGLVAGTSARLGLGNVRVVTGDARQLPNVLAGARADRVLLDAPCSGLGVLNKRADLRWRREAADLGRLAQLQTQLLDGCAEAVRPGGLLVYSTCSIEPEENEMQVASFLERHPEFEPDAASPHVPEQLISAEGNYRTLPHMHGIDGAFGARLRRRN